MDNKNIKAPGDAIRINIHEPYEVDYWTRKMGITKQELEEAVHKVGVVAGDVEIYIWDKKTNIKK